MVLEPEALEHLAKLGDAIAELEFVEGNRTHHDGPNAQR